MLMTITTTASPATDLGYLLHKHPGRVQSFDLSFGQAHVFYPESTDQRCTAALLLDVDPVALVRGSGKPNEGFTLDQYVNDRPYVASSFLSVAIAQVYSSAMSGKCKDRPAAVDTPLPLEAVLAVVPCRGGAALLERLFAPLGYEVAAQPHALDERFPDWGASPYFTVTLRGTVRLRDLLAHIYVLVPVLDREKHYWVGDAEVEKLLRFGAGWLEAHPARELITARYLKHRTSLVRSALARLVVEERAADDEAEPGDAAEAQVEERISLNSQRQGAVLAVLKQSGARSVLDLGCGEGQLLRKLLEDRAFEKIVGMDVAYRTLEYADSKLRLDRLPPMQRARIALIHGSLMYRDERLAGFDAAAVVEVIEHLDPPRLSAFEQVVFAYARPALVVITTPNAEYNVKFETLPAGKFRHKDHRFEWTRNEFQAWAAAIGERHGYSVDFLPVGPVDPLLGSPTQMGVWRRG